MGHRATVKNTLAKIHCILPFEDLRQTFKSIVFQSMWPETVHSLFLLLRLPFSTKFHWELIVVDSY